MERLRAGFAISSLGCDGRRCECEHRPGGGESVSLAAETGKGRLLRAIRFDGGIDGSVGYPSEVLMELFTGFNRQNVVREGDSVLNVGSVRTSDNGKGRQAWLFVGAYGMGCH